MVKIHKTMEKLKRGDRVEIIHTEYPENAPVGSVGIIDNIYIEGDCFGVKIGSGECNWTFFSNEIRLISENETEQASFETQKKQVLAHLQNNPITSWEAINTYRITRLSAVIYELRKTLTITSEWESNELTKKVNEKAKRWTKYTLIK